LAEEIITIQDLFLLFTCNRGEMIRIRELETLKTLKVKLLMQNLMIYSKMISLLSLEELLQVCSDRGEDKVKKDRNRR
jgi:hypothetical protein